MKNNLFKDKLLTIIMADIEINKINNELIEQQRTINIIDYVKEINNIYYKIDIEFIDEFIELVNTDDCCIHHNMLKKYGISTLNGTTNDIKKILSQYDFVENTDYRLRQVSQSNHGGCTHKNEYYLHPRSFKICLMRSLKTKKYAKYYILLEECIKYFNDYQNKLKEKYIIIYKNRIDEQKNLLIVKDDKISNLEKKIDMIIENNNKLLEDNKNTKLINDKLLKYAKNSNDKLDETLEKLTETYEELELTNEKLDTSDKTLNIVSKKLNIAVKDRVVSPKETNTIEYFIVMYNSNSDYQYYIIRGQKRYIKTKKDKLYGFKEIKQIVCVPNSITLWNLMKEKLQNNIDYCGNKLNLINITQENFINKIETIYNERKNISV